MKGKLCVVTGSTSGIGKAIAIGLARRGARVVMAGHDRAEGEQALADVREQTGNHALELEVADFSTLDAVRSFAAAIRARHAAIDVLVNNAGVLCERPEITVDGLEKTWAVNYFAPFLLTHALLDRVAAAPQGRIVNTASVAHRWGRLAVADRDASQRPCESEGFDARGRAPRGIAGVLRYFDTKLALVAFTRSLARRLDAPTTCNCFHPGVIGTNLAVGRGVIGRLMALGRPLMKRPEQGATTALHLAVTEEVGAYNGEYFVDRMPRRPSRKACDDEAAEALWSATVRVTGVGGRMV
jgi:NAD(P)-dependent dehydrogenase (short-subunit alcohol dehydrogenase family)